MPEQTKPAARLDVRMPIDVLKRLKRAAEIQGRTVTDFVVAAADEAACRALEQTEIIRLSLEASGKSPKPSSILLSRRPHCGGPRDGIENCSAWNDSCRVSF